MAAQLTLQAVSKGSLRPLPIKHHLGLKICYRHVEQSQSLLHLSVGTHRSSFKQGIERVDVRSDERLRRGVLWPDRGRRPKGVFTVKRAERCARRGLRGLGRAGDGRRRGRVRNAGHGSARLAVQTKVDGEERRARRGLLGANAASRFGEASESNSRKFEPGPGEFGSGASVLSTLLLYEFDPDDPLPLDCLHSLPARILSFNPPQPAALDPVRTDRFQPPNVNATRPRLLKSAPLCRPPLL
jgi:hypothetical protein